MLNTSCRQEWDVCSRRCDARTVPDKRLSEMFHFGKNFFFQKLNLQQSYKNLTNKPFEALGRLLRYCCVPQRLIEYVQHYCIFPEGNM